MWRALVGASAFFLPLALYVVTLAPTVTLEDSGEFITVAYHLGVPHFSGYPLWCLVAHAFTTLPWGSVAERVHLVSAVFGAASCWLTFRIALRTTGRADAAWIAALALGASQVLWSQSVIAEAYTLDAFFVLLALEWAIRFEETRQTRWLLILAGTLGLGLSNHPKLMMIIPPLAVWLLTIDWRRVLSPKVLAAGLALGLLGLSLYAYVPLRAGQEPPVNVGQADTLQRAFAHVMRRESEAEQVRYQGGASDVALHSLEGLRGTGRALSWPLALLSLAGGVLLARSRPGLFWTCIGIVGFMTVALNLMLHALYNDWWIFVHRVYYIPVHVVAAIWLANGCAALLARAERGPRPLALAATSLLVALVGLSAWSHAETASRRHDFRARDFALDLLDSAPKGAGFLPLGDEVVYPLTYMKFVEGVRPDVSVMSREFGWDGKEVRVLMSGLPIGPALLRHTPELATFHAVPQGLAYRYTRRRPRADGWKSMVALPGEPRDAGLEHVTGDPFVNVLRQIYAAYHARLGARHLAEGRPGAARPELARAELLNPGDAYVDVLLFRIYRDFDLHPERRQALLRRALDDYDRAVDPAIDRYYPLEREEIVALVGALPTPR